MSTPLFLLIGLTLATCVIAYWSDNLGKKLGKKRVSLFGLRPRQTATLMTMTSSVMIMLFTLGALLATNSGLRNALLRYDKERADNRNLRQNNLNLRTEQKQLQSAVKNVQKQAVDARKQASEAHKQAVIAHNKYDAAQNELEEKQKQLRAAQSAERTARSNENAARRGERTAEQRAQKVGVDLQQKKAQLQKVETNLRFAQNDLKLLQTKLGQAQTTLRQAQINLRSTQLSLGQTQNKLAQEQNKLAQAQAKYFNEAKGSLKFQEDLFKEINRRQKEIEDLKTQKVSLDRDIQELNNSVTQLKLLRTQLGQPSEETIDVVKGAVYANALIPPFTNAAETAEKLRAMLKEGRDELARSNEKRTIKLLLKTGEELPQEVIIKSLAQFLQGLNTPASVRLSAFRFHAREETEIQCAFLVVQARVAFRRDEVIASKVIDGSQSDARIFNQLLHDLLDAGESEANKQGVVPILRPGQKLFADNTNERLFEALRRIQALGRPVEVRLLADEDLTTVEQLRVHFQVGTQNGKLDLNKTVSSPNSSGAL